jgi:Undecaprenyl-phosphate galactose phosphotransferase WbaP
MGGKPEQRVALEVKLAAPLTVAAAPIPESADHHLVARAARVAFLCATDLGALIVAGATAYMVWALPARGQHVTLYVQLAPLISLFLFGYAQAGLYPGFGIGPVETLRRLSYVTAFGFLVLAAFSFALKLPPLYSRVTFTLAFVFSLAMVPVARVLAIRAARGWRWWSEPVVVVGTGERASRAIRSIQRAGHFGYRPTAVLAVTALDEATGTDVEGVPVVGGLDQAPVLAAQGIRVALLETRRADPFRERAMVDRLQQHFQHVVLIRDYDDLPVEGLQIRNLGNLVGIEYTNNLLLHGNRVIKRTFDLIVGGSLLVAAAPVIVFAAAIIRLLDGGPAFFVQQRAGLAGRHISVPKIRTMRRGAETRLEQHLEADPGLRQEWESNYKLKSDPRLIPMVGRFFRRFSIDELPQLWTVVKGDMSLIGPRPFPDYHMQHFSQTFLDLRRRVKPGITGLWQITVRSSGDVSEQESYDSYYIRNWSAWFDLYILCRTIAAVAGGRGAY